MFAHDVYAKFRIKPNIVLFSSVIASTLYKYMDKVMLGSISSMIEVGFYEQAEKVIALPLIFIVALGNVMLPRISNLWSQSEDHKEVYRYLTISLLFSLIISTPLCLGILAVSDEFIPFFYGYGYDEVRTLHYILLPSCIFLGIGNVLTTQILIPQKKDNVYVKSIFIGAVVNVVLNSILIGQLGSIGAAVGTLVAESAVCIFKIIYSGCAKKIGIVLLSGFPIIVIGILMMITVANVHILDNNIDILIRVLIGGIVYAIMILPIIRYYKNIIMI